MTRDEALIEAEKCFKRVAAFQFAGTVDTIEAKAKFMQGLAEAGKGFVELAKELRLGS